MQLDRASDLSHASDQNINGSAHGRLDAKAQQQLEEKLHELAKERSLYKSQIMVRNSLTTSFDGAF